MKRSYSIRRTCSIRTRNKVRKISWKRLANSYTIDASYRELIRWFSFTPYQGRYEARGLSYEFLFTIFIIMNNNIIASSPNIQGNISNCEIQTVMVSTDAKALNRSYTEKYQVINKCDNSVISEYEEWAAGFMMIITFFVGIVILFMFLHAISSE